MKSRKLGNAVLSAMLAAYPFSFGHASEEHHDHEEHEHGEDEHGQEQGHEDDHGLVRLTTESQNLGKIKTQPVQAQSLSRKIAVTGKVAQDPEKTAYVVSRQDGILRECQAVLGSWVHMDEVLCVVTGKDGKQIDVKSPAEGMIIAELAKAGEKVGFTKLIFAVADMSKIGVNFDIYEHDAGQVVLGQEVRVYTQAYPDKVFKGKIVFVSPRMEETSNTLRIKALIDNDNQALRLGANVRGHVLLDPGEGKYLTVPTGAIQTVEHKTVVFVRTSPEEFQAREIRIINQDPQATAIEADIQGGAEVVVEGSFILKSKLLEAEMEHSHDH